MSRRYDVLNAIQIKFIKELKMGIFDALCVEIFGKVM
jgi:hypothetical protein